MAIWEKKRMTMEDDGDKEAHNNQPNNIRAIATLTVVAVVAKSEDGSGGGKSCGRGVHDQPPTHPLFLFLHSLSFYALNS